MARLTCAHGTCFLAGATGVLGRRLVPLLLSHGHHVTGFARGADNGYARHNLGWQPAWPSWRDGFKAMTA